MSSSTSRRPVPHAVIYTFHFFCNELASEVHEWTIGLEIPDRLWYAEKWGCFQEQGHVLRQSIWIPVNLVASMPKLLFGFTPSITYEGIPEQRTKVSLSIFIVMWPILTLRQPQWPLFLLKWPLFRIGNPGAFLCCIVWTWSHRI